MKTEILLVLSLILAGCLRDDGPQFPIPATQCLAVDSDELTIDVNAGDTWSGVITFSNSCDTELPLELHGAPAGFTLPTNTTLIPTGGSFAVEVTFSATDPQFLDGELLLVTDPRGNITIPYSGTVAGSQLQIIDDKVGTKAAAGCDFTRPIRLRNTGNLPLSLSEIAVDTTEIEIVNADGTLEIAAGGEATLNLRTSSMAPTNVSTTLSMTTNAYAQPTAAHPLTIDTTYQNTQSATESFPAPKLDILLVMDRGSCSTEHLNTVPTQFDSLQFELKGWDYRAAAVVADDGCVLGDTPFIDGTTQRDAAEAILVTMIDKEFELSPWGTDTERGFTLAKSALSASATCNGDLFRKDAFLHIIYESDEPDQSLEPWQNYVAWFDEYKEGRVVQHGVSGPAPDGCASAVANMPLWSAVEDTEGVFRSICDYDSSWTPTWDKHFEAFGKFIKTNADYQVSLEPLALPGTTQVRIGGAAKTSGWRVSEDGGTLTVEASNIPDGVVVEVAYEAAPAVCP